MPTIRTFSLLTFMAWVAIFTHPLSATAEELAFCGHEDDDAPELRAQAETRTYWNIGDHTEHDDLVQIKILGFNDFHGQLQSRTLSGRKVGGAAVLASYLQNASNTAKDGAIIVHAGDHVGASPPISALLQDEPSIAFLNLLANEFCSTDRSHEEQEEGGKKDQQRRPFDPRCNLVGTLGNHEFDEGVTEMTRLINGGISPKGPFLDPHYAGARFPYINANVVDTKTLRPILQPYVVKKIAGVKIGFIGAVLKETPTIVTPTGVAGVRFLDEADEINRYTNILKRQGVRAIVVTIHQGTSQKSYNGPTQDATSALNGAIGDIVSRLDDEVDIVVSGHAHAFTNALIPNRHGKSILVTQAFSASTAYDDIDVTIDRDSGDIVAKSAAIVTTWADVGPGLTPDTRVVTLVDRAAQVVAPLVNRVVGTSALAITRAENAAGESALGNLIADAQRAAMNADFAFMNPGGIRNDLPSGTVTWGDVFAVQPFSNDLVNLYLTGAQITRLLNQQWDGQPFARVLKPSGLSYQWDNARPANDRVVYINKSDGTPIDPATTYSVVVNSFLAAGGDNFTVLKEGVNRVVGPVDLDALVDYIGRQAQPFSAKIEGRIERVN